LHPCSTLLFLGLGPFCSLAAMAISTAGTVVKSLILLTYGTRAALGLAFARTSANATALPTWSQMANVVAYGNNGGISQTSGGWSQSYAIADMPSGSTEVEFNFGTTSGEAMLGLYGGSTVDTYAAIYTNSAPYFMIYKHLSGTMYVKETGTSFAHRPPGIPSPNWVNDIFKLSVTGTNHVEFYHNGALFWTSTQTLSSTHKLLAEFANQGSIASVSVAGSSACSTSYTCPSGLVCDVGHVCTEVNRAGFTENTARFQSFCMPYYNNHDGSSLDQCFDYCEADSTCVAFYYSGGKGRGGSTHCGFCRSGFSVHSHGGHDYHFFEKVATTTSKRGP